MPTIFTPEDEKALSDINLVLESKRQTIVSIEADFLRLQSCVGVEQKNILALTTEKRQLEAEVLSQIEKKGTLVAQNEDLDKNIKTKTTELSELTSELQQQKDLKASQDSELKAREEQVSLREEKVTKSEKVIFDKFTALKEERLVFDEKVAKLSSLLERLNA